MYADFIVQLIGLTQKVLQRTTYDHFPICIVYDRIDWSLVPFRIDNKWLEVESFRSMIEKK